MTLSALGVVAVYAGSGSPGPFSLTDSGANPILFATNSEIVVSKYINPDDTNPVLQVITTNYTLTGAGLGTPGAVTLTAPLAAGETLLIQRVTASTQALDLAFGGDLSLENLEAELDRQIRLIQELKETANRSLQFPAIRESLANVQTRMVPVPVAGKVLAWSSDATRLVNAASSFLYSGSGAPAPSLGADGDLYVDVVARVLYGPKAAGVWGSSISLTGEQGIQGIQGIPGPLGSGNGDVTGPASSTDNAVVRFDLATGKLLQNSVVLIGDTGAITGALSLDLPNAGLLLRDTNASHTLQITPGSDLTANRTLTIVTGDAAATIYAAGMREGLTASRTYYVRTDGSDNNTGLVDSAGGAFLTIQKAVDVIYGTLDLKGFNVTIQARDGTFARAVVSSPQVGKGVITLQGNSGTPANVILTATGIGQGSGVVDVRNFATLTVLDITITAVTSGSGLVAGGGGVIYFGNIRFGAIADFQIYSLDQATIEATGNYSIVGNAKIHWLADHGAIIKVSARTITLTGTPAFSNGFAESYWGSYIGAVSNTYSGAATGRRFTAQSNGTIETNGGPTEFPGSTAGTVSAGGVHPSLNEQESFIISCSDEVTNIAAGAAKVKFRMPYAFILTEIPRASLSVAQTAGTLVTVDINENGSTILSTKITIDNSESTSFTAATPAVLSDSALALDAEISVDIDAIGTPLAKGLKVMLVGYRT